MWLLCDLKSHLACYALWQEPFNLCITISVSEGHPYKNPSIHPYIYIYIYTYFTAFLGKDCGGAAACSSWARYTMKVTCLSQETGNHSYSHQMRNLTLHSPQFYFGSTAHRSKEALTDEAAFRCLFFIESKAYTAENLFTTHCHENKTK